jgi:hypothetical protein
MQAVIALIEQVSRTGFAPRAELMAPRGLVQHQGVQPT